jgi:hypothetical protein
MRGAKITWVAVGKVAGAIQGVYAPGRRQRGRGVGLGGVAAVIKSASFMAADVTPGHSTAFIKYRLNATQSWPHWMPLPATLDGKKGTQLRGDSLLGAPIHA